MARDTSKARQSKDSSAAVPVLDKGDYNDKKTLSYFLEQEKIAKKMIAEANAFYDSFLSSKIVTLHTVLTRYPLTPIIRPTYKLYYGAAKVKEHEYGESLTYLPDGDDSDIIVAPVFGFDVGSEAEGYFEQELYGQWGFLRDFENCANAVKNNDKQYLKCLHFKKPADVALLYDRYCALMGRLRQATTDLYAVIKAKDLKDYIDEDDMRYIGYSGRSPYDDGGLIGFDMAHCLDKDKYHEASNKWRQRLDIHPIPFKIKKMSGRNRKAG